MLSFRSLARATDSSHLKQNGQSAISIDRSTIGKDRCTIGTSLSTAGRSQRWQMQISCRLGMVDKTYPMVETTYPMVDRTLFRYPAFALSIRSPKRKRLIAGLLPANEHPLLGNRSTRPPPSRPSLQPVPEWSDVSTSHYSSV